MTPPCLFFDGAMLGHLRSRVEGNGLFCVRSGVDKAPSCELTPGSPSPPPCQLHLATQLRSPPSHFASTAPFTPHHLSRSKCEGVLPPPPQLKFAISHIQNSPLTVSSIG